MATLMAFLLPAHGHVNPTLPLTAELARRGERVIFYARESFRANIEAAGADFRPYDDTHDFDPNASVGGPFGLMARSAEAAAAMLPGLLADARRDQPDYLLIDSMCLWGTL